MQNEPVGQGSGAEIVFLDSQDSPAVSHSILWLFSMKVLYPHPGCLRIKGVELTEPRLLRSDSFALGSDLGPWPGGRGPARCRPSRPESGGLPGVQQSAALVVMIINGQVA